MNRRNALLGILVAVIILLLGVPAVFIGAFGFFHPPTIETELTLPTPPQEHSAYPDVQPCNGKLGPVVYYANSPRAWPHNAFGTPIDPRLNPLDEPLTPKPDVHQVVDTSWDRFCRDPELARAVTAAAFPSWDGLRRPFDWTAALNKLYGLNWNDARLVYFAKPPSPSTMMMKHGLNGAPPTTYITRATHGGWYLLLNSDDHQLLLRIGCGDQPSLDLRKGYAQAQLVGIFPTS